MQTLPKKYFDFNSVNLIDYFFSEIKDVRLIYCFND
jgi:hypothetical protein